MNNLHLGELGIGTPNYFLILFFTITVYFYIDKVFGELSNYNISNEYDTIYLTHFERFVCVRWRNLLVRRKFENMLNKS